MSVRFWVSWYDAEPDYRPLNDPPNSAVLGWWCSGETMDEPTRYTLCALLQARNKREARIVDKDRTSVSDSIVFWREGAHGYTVFFDEAGRYTEGAIPHHDDRSFVVPESAVKPDIIRPIVLRSSLDELLRISRTPREHSATAIAPSAPPVDGSPSDSSASSPLRDGEAPVDGGAGAATVSDAPLNSDEVALLVAFESLIFGRELSYPERCDHFGVLCHAHGRDSSQCMATAERCTYYVDNDAIRRRVAAGRAILQREFFGGSVA